MFKNDEQRIKWNAYNNRYAKANYKALNLKLSLTRDKDIIDYLDNAGCSYADTIRKLIRERNK